MAGVIEGFYGPPWTEAERHQLFQWMAGWGLSTYVYCLKDDLKSRVLWREEYEEAEREALVGRIRECEGFGLQFIYGLSPGLDIRYGSEADRERLRARVGGLMELGCRRFAILFDDIPDGMSAEDAGRYGNLAMAQCSVVNELFAWARGRDAGVRFLFCPTSYCGRMALAQLGGQEYLGTVGRELAGEIEVFWTGSEIVSPEITVAHMEAVGSVLRRKPVIWDNLHANDYDGRRFYCGPYSGRPVGLKDVVSGILVNPNCELPLNYLPLRTFSEYLRAEDVWDPRAAYLEAMKDWRHEFRTWGRAFTQEELNLFVDCYYLPYAEGAGARFLLERVKRLLVRAPSAWGEEAEEVRREVGMLRDVCGRMPELVNRSLFYAMYRRIWELREELDLIDRYILARHRSPDSKVPWVSDFHLPGTYRGGMVAGLQRLLVQQPNGGFLPAQGLS